MKVLKNRAVRAVIYMIMIAFAGIIVFSNRTDSSAKYNKLKVSFLDVGQGNATLIQYKNKNYMIDTGEESEYSKCKYALKKMKVKKIDTLIITHNDSDHMGASDLIIRDYKVKNVIQSKYREAKSTYQVRELNSAMSRFKVKKKYVKAGSKVNFGKGVTAKVLSPSKKSSESNENSVVIHMKHGKNSFLFTGDIDAKIENAIISKYSVKSTVLQVAHHGSDYASAILFLKKVSPKYATISVGKNNVYGHPKSSVIKRISNFTKKIYRTDKNGTISYTSTGKKLSVSMTGSKKITTSNSAIKNLSQESNSLGSVIGNVNTKVYHTSKCNNLPYKKNQIVFSSAKEAEKSGYRPHNTCCK